MMALFLLQLALNYNLHPKISQKETPEVKNHANPNCAWLIDATEWVDVSVNYMCTADCAVHVNILL